ncbi:hypothetical protein FPOAC2_09180 [Fusarium poae]|uniref:Uncharacterized protein n=1 Tax=Fusarium poae TaxID=36050 RepID=A0A1B8ANB4_FUSPO|nr:hypothetical protein FPOAC1_009238 [Fusarium poae]KAG8669839.1 hypothetical protein FPOAC1_009238 [Fusarium poae]OBS22050.1 hypothetical protein FPOA_08387 [Fusarium poae]
MPGKASDWDNAEFLMDLVVGLYTGAQTNKGLTPAIKESIEDYLKARGYSTSFDAVRLRRGLSIKSPHMASSPLPTTSPLSTSPFYFSFLQLVLSLIYLSIYSSNITMVKRQVMVWDANVHEDILISLFQHIKPSSDDWTNVMNDLQGKGYSFTESALRQHVQKLRKNRDTAGIQNSGSEAGTPRKPRATAPKTPKRAPKRKAPAKSASIPDEDEEDLEDMKLQLKMEETDVGDDSLLSPKGVKRARTATPKAEPEADDELDSSEV